MITSRWYRMNADWNETPWLADLPYAVRSVWPYLLNHVKLNGTGGVCKAQSVRRFAEKQDIPPRHVAEFLEAAIAHGSLIERDGFWCIPTWEQYQPDPTTNKRQKEFREMKSTQIEPSVTDRNGCITVEGRYVTDRNAQTETLTETKTLTERVDAPTKRFVKPTISEVKDYCRSRNNNIDAEKFWHYYEAKGWVVGKSPIKNWKSCVFTWEKSEKTSNPSQNSAPSKPAPKECPEW